MTTVTGDAVIQHDGALQADDITRHAYKTWDELYAEPRAAVEAWQLQALARRFEELRPQIAALRDLADRHGITRIRELNDVVPLLFNHPEYKSYPIALIEKAQFGRLTPWLQRYTAIDLSGVDASDCTGIDDWLDRLERDTALRVYLTSGTSGKVSFLPRSTLEVDITNHCLGYGMIERGFGSEPHTPITGPDAVRLPLLYPGPRHGRFTAQRILDHYAHTICPTPADCHTPTGATQSADLISLSGRVRIAQAKGEVSRLKLTEDQRRGLLAHIEYQNARPQQMADFFIAMAEKFAGQRVLLFAQTNFLYPAARQGLEKGIRHAFKPDSIGCSGGGSKDVVLPPDWRAVATEFSGIARWNSSYAMSELLSIFPNCPQGHFHLHPLVIPFLLDPETGAPLPRTGVQTGRFAGFDLLAQTLWGGTISGDKVTIDWDGACGCGRKGAFVHDSVERYATSVTGDDKVTCAATIDNTDAALQRLLQI
jgi:hypothetical protein